MTRSIGAISAILLVGAVFNVAVAWACAMQAQFALAHEPERFGCARQGQFVVSFFQFNDFGSSRILLNVSDNASSTNIHFPAEPLPHWAKPSIDEAGGALNGFAIDAAGLPIRCLTCMWVDNWTLCNGIAIKSGSQAVSVQRGYSALPTRPIMWGFVFNTAFYSIVIWGMFIVPFALRRRRRIARGMCPQCGYDVRNTTTSVCPECGHSR